MKVGSLFSGIGGLDLACERVFGAETVWQVEGIDLALGIEDAWQRRLGDPLAHPIRRSVWAKVRDYVRHGDFNRRVLARHWPKALQLCDVRTVGAHNLKPVDVICGGFPCQDLSVAGNRAGLDGSRSGLYRELHRIVGELLPRWVVIENVPGLMKYRARLTRDFAALGYGLRWQPIAAQDVGAPHRRRRVFVLACRDWRGSVVLEAPRAGDRAVVWPTPRARHDSGSGSKGDLTTQGAARAAAWPTPTAKIGESGPSKLNRPGHGGGAHAGTTLTDAVRPDRAKAWPTPTARDSRSGTGTGTNRGHAPCLPEVLGGNLNPAWVELLMGLPSGWSEAPRKQWDLFAPRLGPMQWPGDHRWPVGIDPATRKPLPQPAGEPPRLVLPNSVRDRNLRLRSLGNGVVPQQAIAALLLILSE